MTAPPHTQPNFDAIAKPYRWLEALTVGNALHRARTRFLPRLTACRRALVLGDGDGRFLAALLAANPHLAADAVDTSAAMLQLLARRVQDAAPNAAERLRTHQASALDFTPSHPVDLVATHFFLDCLSQPELEALCDRLAPHLTPGALWVVSDFRIPAGPLHWPGRALVRALYMAFRVLTGLRTTQLPDHAAALARIGLVPIARHLSVAGLVAAELWQLPAR